MNEALCSVEGCEQPLKVRGMCRRHYQQWWNSKGGKAAARRYGSAKVLTLPSQEAYLGYLAGLLDGPGSITWRDTERRGWRVRVFTSDREIIDYLMTIGGTWSQQLPKNRRGFVYEWDLSPQEHVRDFLAAVAPYLKSYAKQARAREAVRRIEARIGPSQP
jgi:hypothetical protein